MDHKSLLQLQANKLDNLEEMNKFFRKHNLSTNHEEAENLSRPVTSAYERAWAKRKQGVDDAVIDGN